MLVENETIDKMPDETMFQSKHGLVNGGGGVCVCLCSFYRYVFISAIVQLLSHSSVPKISSLLISFPLLLKRVATVNV